MPRGKNKLDPSATHILTSYAVDGYSAGDISPIEIGEVLMLTVETTSMTGERTSAKIIVDSETALEFAKTILLVQTELGNPELI